MLMRYVHSRVKALGLLCLAAVTGQGCGNSSDSGGRHAQGGNSGNVVPEVELGTSCGDCDGTFCRRSGTHICPESDLPIPCIGTASGMYCSKSCASDDDCAPASRTMKCLTSCSAYPEAQGACWTQSEYDFMSSKVCGIAAPSGTGGSKATGGSGAFAGSLGSGGASGIAGARSTGGSLASGGFTSSTTSTSNGGSAPAGGVTSIVATTPAGGNKASGGTVISDNYFCRSATIRIAGFGLRRA
jgi:hypothetical protein